jgi:hypothetical protein
MVLVGMPIGLFKNKNLEHNKIVYQFEIPTK